MTIHILKTEAPYFGEVRLGKKPFEVRKDDREPPYETGDVVALVFTGEGPWHGDVEIRRIGYLARGGRIPDGYCVFELQEARSGDDARVEMAMGKSEVSQ